MVISQNTNSCIFRGTHIIFSGINSAVKNLLWDESVKSVVKNPTNVKIKNNTSNQYVTKIGDGKKFKKVQ